MKHTVLQSSFLRGIPPQNAMKSKLPFDGAERSAYGKEEGESPAAARRMRKGKNPWRAKGRVDQEDAFTRWSFCFVRAECYLISGRQILSLTLSSAKPDGRLFKE